MVHDQGQSFSLLRIRFRWFILKAGEFIKRNQTGILIVLFLLPGVAVGENLLIFYRFLATPFLQVAEVETAMLTRILSWLSVLVICLSSAKSQSQAIQGGTFATYLQSMPFKRSQWLQSDILMLLVSNHLLWVLLMSPVLLPDLHGNARSWLYFANAGISIVSVLIAQWLMVFSAPLKAKLLWLAGVMSFLLLTRWFQAAATLTAVALFVIAASTLFQPRDDDKTLLGQHWNLFNRLPFWPSYYVQILFKTALASSLMRLGLCVLILMAFVQFSGHLLSLNDGDLHPFLLVMTALWAFWLSGLYVQFQDTRMAYQEVLQTLPFHKLYWFIKDYVTVAILGSGLYALCRLVLPGEMAVLQLLGFQLILLLAVYPLRISGAGHQPFTSFMVVLLLTVIWITFVS
ncbi:hypothetical protein [Marinicella sp. W31]|uniref:hypothetical protein n=1 Tax=Marinicella sp. W31 TaxID=3023713 RepID=UPI003756AA89